MHQPRPLSLHPLLLRAVGGSRSGAALLAAMWVLAALLPPDLGPHGYLITTRSVA